MALIEVLLLHVVQVSLAIGVLTFTSPNSISRPAFFPIILGLTVYILPNIHDSVQTDAQASFFTTSVVGIFLQYLDFGLISRWSFLARGPTSDRGRQPVLKPNAVACKTGEDYGHETSCWTRLKWGVDAIMLWRAPGTIWEAKGTPHFDSHDSARVPSRSRFLRKTIAKLLLSWLVFDLLSLLPPMTAQQREEAFMWQKVPFFSRVSDAASAQEILIRVQSTFLFWLATYFILDMFYCAASLLGVMLGFGAVDRWRPLFGSVTQSSSIRRFWGQFWHQAMRPKLTSPAFYMTYTVLGYKRRGRMGRYVFIMLTFAVSGLFHTAQEYTAGVPLEQSGSMRFFCMQGIGILIEDAAQGVRLSLGVAPRKSGGQWLGYVWVVLWMIWTTPAWAYPKLRNVTGTPRDRMSPFSILGPVLSGGRGTYDYIIA
ncbi:hypothetical protein NPX13_g392 [Xylaria arbuscula]|uniref:Wax synthase domain-containing protein n=1 Tax=Xylaria arbuscula TaxID=114810 RepID=A0A9W8NP05_9PEZI|nr:hypothetical protein NPX13_g392 [Xylaria arbuscula]